MYEYKTVNLWGGAPNTMRMVDADKINTTAADGWRLVFVIVPERAGAMSHDVIGIFEREVPVVREARPSIDDPEPDRTIEAPKFDEVTHGEITFPKRRGRPPKNANS